MDIDNKQRENIKKLLCYNIVNNSKCVYKGKCMFAHTLSEQKKDPIREIIYDMIYHMDDLSEIDIYDDKVLFDDLTIYTKECKNCINKKCPGGYNCKFGACCKEIKICYNDMMYGRCYNSTKDEKNNHIIIKRCIHGVHLTEKNLIPYYQRLPLDIYSEDTGIFHFNNINFNTKNNTISLVLNDKTISVAKDIINKKMGKNDFIKYCTEISKSVNIDTEPSNIELLDNDEIEELRKYKYNEYYENFNELIIENTEIYQNNDTELENITVKMNNNDNVIVDNLNQECSKINYDKIKNKFLNIEIYGEENKKIDNELDNELDNNLVSIDIKQKENSCINIIFDNEKEYPKINNIDVE
jgi:hypothetical protein